MVDFADLAAETANSDRWVGLVVDLADFAVEPVHSSHLVGLVDCHRCLSMGVGRSEPRVTAHRLMTPVCRRIFHCLRELDVRGVERYDRNATED